MNSKMWTLTVALALLATTAIPVHLAEQSTTEQVHPQQFHHYQLIDMGTFGGPGGGIPNALQSTSTSPQPDSLQPDSTPCYNGGNPGFCLTATALSPGTVSPGGTSTSDLQLEAAGGFYQSVGLLCSVQPSPALAPTCSISSLNGLDNAYPGWPITMTVKTTGPAPARVPFGSGAGLYALWLPLIGLVGTGVGLGPGQTKKARIPVAVLACMLFVGLAFLLACGSSNYSAGTGGNSGTPAGVYTITITGTSNGVPANSVTTMLTVQ